MVSLVDPECHRQVSGIAAKAMKKGNGIREEEREKGRKEGRSKERKETKEQQAPG